MEEIPSGISHTVSRRTPEVEIIVVGGGIAGLTSALRLALSGMRVCLIEQGYIGSASTGANHGIIHSGAFYAAQHPAVTMLCQEAQTAWRTAFPQAGLGCASSWYIAPEAQLPGLLSVWDRSGIRARPVPPDRAAEQLGAEAASSVRAAEIDDFMVSTRDLTVALAQRCANAGVDIYTGTVVREITRSGDVFILRTGADETFRSARLVLCAGLGTGQMLAQLKSAHTARLRSRLSLMVAVPNQGLRQPVFSLSIGGPTMAPAQHDMVLISRYGARERPITGPSRWAVPLDELAATINAARTHVREGLLDFDHGVTYVASKTEFAHLSATRGSISPSFAVVDHSIHDGIPGLWTVLPGKMTLALHASRELVRQVSHHDVPLDLPPASEHVSADVLALIANAPWIAAARMMPSTLDTSMEA